MHTLCTPLNYQQFIHLGLASLISKTTNWWPINL